jgi:hypothetical protein
MRLCDRIDTDPVAFSIRLALLCRDDKALKREGAPVRTSVSGRLRREQTDGWTRRSAVPTSKDNWLKVCSGAP